MDRTELMVRADRAEVEGRLLEAIDALQQANRAAPDLAVESRLVRLRHLAFTTLPAVPGRAQWPPQCPDQLPRRDVGATRGRRRRVDGRRSWAVP